MWPWEHLAIGYLTYSVTVRTLYGRLPTSVGTVALAIATQFPDLIDKPGSWIFGVLPSGTSVAHSVFVAVPISLLVLAFTGRRRTPKLGIAFVVGYLSHLFGDVAYPALLGRGVAINAVVWPVGPEPEARSEPVFSLVADFFTVYIDYLASPAGVGYILVEGAVLALALWLWRRDQMPGPATLHRLGR